MHFFNAATKPISILYWFSDLQFQHNIPICLGLINLSVDFYFLKVTSLHTFFTNHKQTSPFTKPPSHKNISLQKNTEDKMAQSCQSSGYILKPFTAKPTLAVVKHLLFIKVEYSPICLEDCK